MSDTVTLTIDGQEITVSAEATILEAAAQLGIDIPVICYHPHLTANGLCRVCSVDAGGRLQAAACVTQCRQGMQVETNSDAVRRGRRTILELLASTVDLEEAPEILALVAAYSAEINRFSGAKRESPSTTTTRSTCATTINASTAGAACKSVLKTPNTPLRSISTVAASTPPSAPIKTTA